MLVDFALHLADAKPQRRVYLVGNLPPSAISPLGLDAGSAVIILTNDLKFDETLCEKLFSSGFLHRRIGLAADPHCALSKV